MIQLGVPDRRIHQRFLGDQSDQFAVMNGDAVALGFAPNGFDHAREGRLAEVGEVHRDLRAAIHEQAQPFDIAQPARRMPNGLGDFLGDVHIARGEIHVEGDQRIARADDGCSRRAKSGGTEIGLALGVGFDLGFEPLVLTFADVFEIGAFGTSCRRFIQIDGDAEFVPDALTQPFGQCDAIVHAGATERDERDHVRRADARMRARVAVQVDQFGGGLDGAEGGVLHRERRTCQRQHRAVVVEVGGTVEQSDLADGFNGGDDLVDHFGSPRFGKIGNTFDELSSHVIPFDSLDFKFMI